MFFFIFFFCKQKTAYDMRISDWSSDVCSSDLVSFGASEATITYLGETTLPAGTRVFVQFDELGAGASRPDFGVALPAGCSWSNICAVNLGAPLTADAVGVCASPAITAVAGGTINGAFAT